MDEAVPEATAVLYDPDDPIPLPRLACDTCLADHAASGHNYQYLWLCPDRGAHPPLRRPPRDHSRPHPHHPPGTHDDQPRS